MNDNRECASSATELMPCRCDHAGTCLGCLATDLIEEHLGTAGLDALQQLQAARFEAAPADWPTDHEMRTAFELKAQSEFSDLTRYNDSYRNDKCNAGWRYFRMACWWLEERALRHEPKIQIGPTDV